MRVAPEILNVACEVRIADRVDVEEAAIRVPNCTHTLQQPSFCRVYIRLGTADGDARTVTCRVQKEGRVLMMGPRSEEDGRRATRMLTRLLRESGQACEEKWFQVISTIASCAMDGHVDLDQLFADDPINVDYTPGDERGVAYIHSSEPKATVSVFRTGTVTATVRAPPEAALQLLRDTAGRLPLATRKRPRPASPGAGGAEGGPAGAAEAAAGEQGGASGSQSEEDEDDFFDSIMGDDLAAML